MKNYHIPNFYRSLHLAISKNISNYKGAVNDIENNNTKYSQYLL